AQVSVGNGHACALTSSSVMCWGANSAGQLGNGTTDDSSLPVGTMGNGYTQISAGSFHTCALTTSGGVKCWGLNIRGQLGNGTTGPSSIPVDVTGLTSGAIQVRAGDAHTCALMASGGIKCWGWNSNGQLGDNTNIQRLTPVDVFGLTSGMAQIS